MIPFRFLLIAPAQAHHSIGFLAGSHAAKHDCGYSDVYPRDDCLVQLAENLTQEPAGCLVLGAFRAGCVSRWASAFGPPPNGGGVLLLSL